MINNDQITLLLSCFDDIKLHRSGSVTVPLKRNCKFSHSHCQTPRKDLESKLVYNSRQKN